MRLSLCQILIILLVLIYIGLLCWRLSHTSNFNQEKSSDISTHFPLTKTAFYINMDKDTSRNGHIQTLLNSIGF